jgi:seryl-tRNA synthetase
MKRSIFLLFVVAITISNIAFAKEKKKSKKEIAQEQALEAATKPFRDKVTLLEAQLAKAEEDKAKALEDINVLNEENKALQKEAMQMQQAAEKATSAPKMPDGLAFKIQLGAYNTDNKTLQTEEVEGKNKYVIGFFKDFADAKAAEKDFKKLGIKGTWLVPYKNGARISDSEANSILNFDIRKTK